MRRQVPAERLIGLGDADRGLASGEVEARRARFGSNDIIETRARGWRDVVEESAKDPMIWFLAATASLFAFVGQYREAAIMAGAMAPLLGMDAFLHRRTQASTQGLRSRLADRATVIRDGRRCDVDAREVVAGDLAVVTTGSAFPADGIVVEGQALQVDESALTGEAFPVRKAVVPELPGSEATVDGSHWGFAGTRLLTGDARIRIINVGAQTLYGEIVRSAVRSEHARTPLQRSIGSLVTGLIAAAGALCVALAWIRIRQGHGLLDALVSAVTLAVAALPEEFPVVFTFFLGVGIFRLARHQALVRRAVVVENIGRVSCICSDKTGTLTEGRLRIAHCFGAANVAQDDVLRTAALASRAESGDPLDAAILAAAPSSPDVLCLTTYPFTEERRRETAAFRTDSSTVHVVTKGAPETILPLCKLSAAERHAWEHRVLELAEGGQKIIACASLMLSEHDWRGTEPTSDYELAGVLACEDPVREGVVDAVRQATDAGIRVILITGDHPATASAVAREVGIGGTRPTILDGDLFEQSIVRGDADLLGDVDVIARAVPAQKLMLVRALQSRGEIVAVTGDGVNDVPALQAADVGIAMGERGTRSAREVGAIVLLDDNFRTIVRAIREGRQLFHNLRLSFAYLLMIHIPLVATAMLIPLAGYPLLYLPTHVVWLELIIHPTALLVFQETRADTPLARRGERERTGRFFTHIEWVIIGAVGAIVTAVVVLGYDRSLGSGTDVEHGRAMALVSLVVASATLTASLSRLRTITARSITVAALVSAVALVQIPMLADLIHVQPLHVDDWLIASAGGVVPGILASLFVGR